MDLSELTLELNTHKIIHRYQSEKPNGLPVIRILCSEALHNMPASNTKFRKEGNGIDIGSWKKLPLFSMPPPLYDPPLHATCDGTSLYSSLIASHLYTTTCH